MRLGMIGLGNFSKKQHTPALRKYAEEVAPVEWVTCDASAAARASWVELFGDAPHYGSVSALLTEGGIDAAYVLVPPTACCEVVCQCLRAGFPTFTEKPPGMTAQETQQMIDAAKDLPHAVGFNRRFSPVLCRARAMTQDLGLQPHLVRCTFLRRGRYDLDFTTTLIHGVDALRHLGGDVEALDVRVLPVHGDKPYRNILLQGRFTSGTQLQMSIHPVCGRAVERYEIVGEDVTVEARQPMAGLSDTGEVLVYAKGELCSRVTETDLGIAGAPDFVRFGFYDQARHFLQGLAQGTSPGTPFTAALQSVAIAEFLRDCPGACAWP